MFLLISWEMSDFKSNSVPEFYDTKFLDKLCTQCQRLRNSVVQTILKNDPFATGVINQNDNTPREPEEFNIERVMAYLQGDAIRPGEERQIVRAIRSMSAVELCKTTDTTLATYKKPCNCHTCVRYDKENFYDELRQSDVNISSANSDIASKNMLAITENEMETDITKLIQEKYQEKNLVYFKYVDSLRIAVHSLMLNDMGYKKVTGSETHNKIKVPISLKHTYFVEYRIPESLVKPQPKMFSAVDNNFIRICSKKLQKKAVYFKQISIHDVKNLNDVKPEDKEITFKIKCRTLNQKTATLLGVANFDLNFFNVAKYLTCIQDLVIKSSGDSPIILGALNVSLQLGCGRLYFGKEFIDAVSSNVENVVLPVYSDVSIESPKSSDNKLINTEVALDYFSSKSKKLDSPKKSIQLEPVSKNRKSPPKGIESTDKLKPSDCIVLKELPLREKTVTLNSSRSITDKDKDISADHKVPEKVDKFVQSTECIQNLQSPPIPSNTTEAEKQILFGFLYISEAEYFNDVRNSYFHCRPFGLDEIISSRPILNTSKPVFNFYQLIPLIYEEKLLHCLRENYVTIEFFNKPNGTAFGLTKLPLQQFYLTYRDRIIVKYLLKNQLPIIGTDWWEPIQDAITEEIVGQVQVLSALGSEEQIKHLEAERGFRKNVVIPQTVAKHPEVFVNKEDMAETTQTQVTPPVEKHTVSTGVQYDLEVMNSEVNNVDLTKKVEAFFKSMMEHQDNHPVTEENAEMQQKEVAQNVEMLQNMEKRHKESAKILEYLEKETEGSDRRVFRARINVDCAMHLPVKRKNKLKKSKTRNSRKCDEIILPTTYVTFETSDKTLTTLDIPRSTNPEYNFMIDCVLPAKLLLNEDELLVFKVWKRQTNVGSGGNVLGIAVVNLTGLMLGLPTIDGWYNITDLRDKVQGQLKIKVTPLEDLELFKENSIKFKDFSKELTLDIPANENHRLIPVDSNTQEEPGELLSRALKRKFTELEEITQRLRLRLSKVTNDESDNSIDDVADQFERDINTQAEEDCNMIDFDQEYKALDDFAQNVGLLQLHGVTNEGETSGSNMVTERSQPTVSKLEKDLAVGKQKIDTLLEQLSLGSNLFSSRYVSGCSVNQDSETSSSIELPHKPEHNLTPAGTLEEELLSITRFQEFYSTALSDSQNSSNTLTSSSSSSLISDFAAARQAPEGAGFDKKDDNKSNENRTKK